MKKYIIALLIICFMLTSFSFSSDLTMFDPPPIQSNGVDDVVNKTTSTAFELIQSIGILLALLLLTFIGIQFLMATAQKKAEIKSKLWNVFLGVAILLLAPTLLKVIGDFFYALR